jgi:hypothetical protein
MQVGRQSRECEPRRPRPQAPHSRKRPNASVIVDIAIDTVTELPWPAGSMPSGSEW